MSFKALCPDEFSGTATFNDLQTRREQQQVGEGDEVHPGLLQSGYTGLASGWGLCMVSSRSAEPDRWEHRQAGASLFAQIIWDQLWHLCQKPIKIRFYYTLFFQNFTYFFAKNQRIYNLKNHGFSWLFHAVKIKQIV